MFKLDRLNPISAIVASEIAAKVWCGLFFALLIYSQYQPHLIVNSMKQKEKYIILSQSGEIIYAQDQDWENATKLHGYVAKRAVAAVVMRNPAGFDDQDLIDRLFTSETKNKLNKIFSDSEKEFRDKNIHQKGEITEWIVLDKGSMEVEDKDTGKKNPREFVTIRVDGQLIRDGVVKGLPFRDTVGFKMTLTLVRNNQLLQNHFLPLIVADFDYEEKPL
jgi:hypothetical protein